MIIISVGANGLKNQNYQETIPKYTASFVRNPSTITNQNQMLQIESILETWMCFDEYVSDMSSILDL